MARAGVRTPSGSKEPREKPCLLPCPGRRPRMTQAVQAGAGAGTREQVSYPWLDRYPKDVDWHQQFTPLPMHQLLAQSVAKHASRTCTSFLGQRLTYSEIGQQVDRAAAGL